MARAVLSAMILALKEPASFAMGAATLPCFLHHQHLQRFTARHKLKPELIQEHLIEFIGTKGSRYIIVIPGQTGSINNRLWQQALDYLGKTRRGDVVPADACLLGMRRRPLLPGRVVCRRQAGRVGMVEFQQQHIRLARFNLRRPAKLAFDFGLKSLVRTIRHCDQVINPYPV